MGEGVNITNYQLVDIETGKAVSFDEIKELTSDDISPGLVLPNRLEPISLTGTFKCHIPSTLYNLLFYGWHNSHHHVRKRLLRRALSWVQSQNS